MTLRENQALAVARVEAALEYSGRSVAAPVVCSPTGSGKSIILAELARRFVGRGRILLLVHRRNLVIQLARQLELHCGCRVGVEMGARHATDEPIVVASRDSLGRADGRRLRRFDPAEFVLVLVDEVHRAAPGVLTYQRIFDHFADVPRAGLTATVQRGDGVGLSGWWTAVVHVDQRAELIDDGFLVPVRRDIVEAEATNLAEQWAAAVAHWQRRYRDRQFLAFVTRKAQADDLAAAFRRAGALVAAVNESTPDHVRERLEDDFRRGRLHGLVSVGVYTEGTDLPSASVVLMLRNTGSSSSYIQMVGRGARIWSAERWDAAHPRRRWDGDALGLARTKAECVVVDFTGVSLRHGLEQAVSLAGENEVPLRRRSKRRPAVVPEPVEPADAPSYLHQIAAHPDPERWSGHWRRDGEAWVHALGHRVYDAGSSPAGRWRVEPPSGRPCSWSSLAAAFAWAEQLAGQVDRPAAEPPIVVPDPPAAPSAGTAPTQPAETIVTAEAAAPESYTSRLGSLIAAADARLGSLYSGGR